MIFQLKLQKAILASRIAIFIVFFWFGFLKVIGLSPAEGLVTDLFNLTLKNIMPIEIFLPIFGLFECILGVLWLIPSLTRISFFTLCFHMICTFLPMILLINQTWQNFLTLTLVGQYIMKNIVIIALGFLIWQYNGLQKSLSLEPRTLLKKVA